MRHAQAAARAAHASAVKLSVARFAMTLAAMSFTQRCRLYSRGQVHSEEAHRGLLRQFDLWQHCHFRQVDRDDAVTHLMYR